MLLRSSARTPRLLHWLLAILLFVAQLGSWLHQWSHFQAGQASAAVAVIADASPDAAGDNENDDAADRQCLLCLSYAVLALALLGVPFVLPLGAAGKQLSPAAIRPAPVFRRLAFPARGPPRLS